MSFYAIPLKYTPSRPWACLRSICGFDELEAGDDGIASAIQLINRLMVASSEFQAEAGWAREMTAPDRDRILAIVYQNTYGAQIESTIHCRQCEMPFDLDFSLQNLLQHLEPGPDEAGIERLADGIFKLTNGIRFRLPTGEDECAVLGLPAEAAALQLLERCLLEGDAGPDGDKVQKAMEKVAPMLDMEMLAQCPECGCRQTVHFDIQSYLLSTLIQEQRVLPIEVHKLALAYGWSLREILELPRNLRKMHVALIEEYGG